MKSMRIASVWLLAMALVGFTYPALAQKSQTQTKYGSVDFQAPITVAGQVTVQLKFLNSTPKPGVSVINSAWVKIKDPSPTGSGVAGVQKLTLSDGTVDNSVTAKDYMTGALCTMDQPCKEFTITNFVGISNNQSGTFLLTLVGLNENECTKVLWDAEANTGNSYPGGDTFELTKYNLATGCDGELKCAATSTSGVNTFNGSVGAPNVDFSGFFEGWRALNWKSSDPTDCTPVAYRTYNNINGTGPMFDAFNTSVPPNFAVINYSGSSTNGVLLAHTITFAVEPSDINGLPDSTKKTYYCVPGTDCLGTNRKVAKGCSSFAVDIDSIPYVNSVQEPGCIRGANWVIVPATDDSCVAANTAAGKAPAACIQWAIDFLEQGDPPWGRTS